MDGDSRPRIFPAPTLVTLVIVYHPYDGMDSEGRHYSDDWWACGLCWSIFAEDDSSCEAPPFSVPLNSDAHSHPCLT